MAHTIITPEIIEKAATLIAELTDYVNLENLRKISPNEAKNYEHAARAALEAVLPDIGEELAAEIEGGDFDGCGFAASSIRSLTNPIEQ